MHVYINDRDVGPIATPDCALGEVVDAVRVHVDPTEIVTAVEVDGIRHPLGADDRWARRAASGIDRLVLTTETPAAFAAGKRSDLAVSIGVIARKVGMAVALLRQPDERAANALLAALMEELRLGLMLDHQLALLERRAASAAREEILVFAPMLLEAQERREWRRLAELLATRLVPVLERWQAAVAGLQPDAPR